MKDPDYVPSSQTEEGDDQREDEEGGDVKEEPVDDEYDNQESDDQEDHRGQKRSFEQVGESDDDDEDENEDPDPLAVKSTPATGTGRRAKFSKRAKSTSKVIGSTSTSKVNNFFPSSALRT